MPRSTCCRSTTGAGSQAARHALLADLFGRATAAEADFLGRLFMGEMRTGALAGVVTDAIAAASGVKLAAVRRAAMLAGDLAVVAGLALTQGSEAAVEPSASCRCDRSSRCWPRPASRSAAALDEVGPAPASSGSSTAPASRSTGRATTVRIYTRNLNDVTDRLPEVVETVLGIRRRFVRARRRGARLHGARASRPRRSRTR